MDEEKIILKKLKMTYYNMLSRCYNTKNHNYHLYGLKGVKVCKEWLDKENGFTNFYNWAIENGYKIGLELDKDIKLFKKNSKEKKIYNPKNCSFVTKQENLKFRDSNVFLKINGEIKSISDVSLENGIKIHTILSRIRKGYTLENCLKKERVKYERKNLYYYSYKENMYSLKELIKILDIKRTTFVMKTDKWLEENKIKKIRIKGEKNVK